MSTPDPLQALDARLKALEGDAHKASTEVHAAVTSTVAFVKKNWGHFVTWILVGYGSGVIPAVLRHL